MRSKIIAVAFAYFFLTGIAHAQTLQETRCNPDSLTVDQAIARLEWARRCALAQSPVSYQTPIPFTSPYPEYSETTARRFVGTSYGVNDTMGMYHQEAINTAYMKNLYNFGIPGGTTTLVIGGVGYSIWTANPSDAQKPRPTYPTFGTDESITAGQQLWPSAHWDPSGFQDPNDCNLYTVAHVAVSAHYVNGYCTSSCYAPDQRVLFASDGASDGASVAGSSKLDPLGGGHYERIIDAFTQQSPVVMTLTPESTRESFSLHPKNVYSYTTELRDSDHQIYVIRTAHGTLRVTAEHTVVTSDGRIVFAKDLKVKDKLVRVDGSVSPILGISMMTHHGKVYNVRPNSSNLLENIVIAEGFLVGSSQYQNDYVNYVNSVILGHALPSSILPGDARKQ